MISVSDSIFSGYNVVSTDLVHINVQKEVDVLLWHLDVSVEILDSMT